MIIIGGLIGGITGPGLGTGMGMSGSKPGCPGVIYEFPSPSFPFSESIITTLTTPVDVINRPITALAPEPPKPLSPIFTLLLMLSFLHFLLYLQK